DIVAAASLVQGLGQRSRREHTLGSQVELEMLDRLEVVDDQLRDHGARLARHGRYAESVFAMSATSLRMNSSMLRRSAGSSHTGRARRQVSTARAWKPWRKYRYARRVRAGKYAGWSST